MNRFRFTLLAFCLVLGFLGWNDLTTVMKNPVPATIHIQELQQSETIPDWLSITGGRFDLMEAISTSGRIELDALLIPLKSDNDPSSTVLVETRRPQMLELFRTYHFNLDSPIEKKAFLEKQAHVLNAEVVVTGMTMSGRIAEGNRKKLLKLAKETNVSLTEETLLFTEGKQPSKYRGFFFTAMALLGLGRFIQLQRRKTSRTQS